MSELILLSKNNNIFHYVQRNLLVHIPGHLVTKYRAYLSLADSVRALPLLRV